MGGSSTSLVLTLARNSSVQSSEGQESSKPLKRTTVTTTMTAPTTTKRPSMGIKVKRIMGPIPSLVIPGIDKGGTTEAYAMLHREFLLEDGGGNHKELGCLYQAFPIPGQELAKVRSCYSAFFHELGTNASEHILPVDATPNYLYSNQPNPLALSPPKVLSVISPQASVLFLLREPISRIRSLYNFWWRFPTAWDSTGSLEEQLEEELEFLKNIQLKDQHLFAGFMDARCVKENSCNVWDFWIQLRAAFQPAIRNVRRGRNPRIDRKPIMAYVFTSMYFPFLYTWLQFFHRVAVIQAEYFFQNTSRLWQILGIQPHQTAPLHPPGRPINKVPYGESANLSEALRGRLQVVFRQLLRRFRH